MAAISRSLPPSISGQPVVCASIISVRPKALVSGLDSGRSECPATPASSARASGVCRRRASTLAGSSPSAPKRAAGISLSGRERSGASASDKTVSLSRTSGSIRCW